MSMWNYDGENFRNGRVYDDLLKYGKKYDAESGKRVLVYRGWKNSLREKNSLGHSLLGDDQIFMCLRKDSQFYIFDGEVKIRPSDYLISQKNDCDQEYEYYGDLEEPECPEDQEEYAADIEEESWHNSFTERAEIGEAKPAVFEIKNHKLEYFLIEQNGDRAQYARLTQPNGVIWTGYSGYHGITTDLIQLRKERLKVLRALFNGGLRK